MIYPSQFEYLALRSMFTKEAIDTATKEAQGKTTDFLEGYIHSYEENTGELYRLIRRFTGEPTKVIAFRRVIKERLENKVDQTV